MQESRTEGMVSKEWIQATRTYFLDFLHTTGFPALPRHGDNSVRLNFCMVAELSDATGRYGRSTPFHWPTR